MGLLDAFIQYAKDAMPGGLLNAETQPVVDRAKYIGGLLDPNSQVSQDARNWHGKVQSGLQDQLAGLQTPAADYAHQQMMNMAGIAPLGMIAWHGSPHKFDKFSLDKIGTGEGAQAYGHGLYLAESQGVGKSYRDALTTGMNKYLIDGKPAGQAALEEKWLVENYMTALKRNGGDANAAIKELQSEAQKSIEKSSANLAEAQSNLGKTVDMGEGWGDLRHYTYTPDDVAGELESVKRAQEYAKRVASLTPEKISESPGYLYKTDIPDEAVARFLDWDKPLSQQAPEVLDAIKKSSAKYGPVRGNSPIYSDAAAPYMTGHDFYRDLANALSDGGVRRGSTALSGQDAIASKHLQDLGVHGIRYLDGGSRSAGNGTSNFVAFDPEMIRILERNGQPTGLQPWKPGEWNRLTEALTAGSP